MRANHCRYPICWGVAAIVCGLGWSLRYSSRNAPLVNLETNQFYSITVDSGQAQVDLMFEKGTRYALIVGSLGKAKNEYSVKLNGTRLSSPSDETTTAVLPLVLSRKRSTSPVTPSTASKTQTPLVLSQESKVGSQRKFYLHVTDGDLNDPKQYVRTTARVITEGEQVRVYLDENLRTSEICDLVDGEIIRLLDKEIIPRIGREIGSFRDVDQDGKLAILLTPWLGRLQGGKTSIGGFVRPSDFRSDLKPPFSNQCDTIYLNSNLRSGLHLQDLLAHEYTHVVCSSLRLSGSELSGRLPDEEDWLNEAIAHLSENNGTNLDYRISRFLNDPQQYPLVVPDYFRAGMWRNHGCRGATFLFLRWVSDEYGVDVRRRLVQGRATGIKNLHAATGSSFEYLFRQWTIALWKSGRTATSHAQQHSAGVGLVPTQETRQASKTAKSAEKPPTDNMQLATVCRNLRGNRGKWGLAGPLVKNWCVSPEQLNFNLRGTAAKFLEITVPQPGRYRLKLETPNDAKLQISVVKIPLDWPRMTMKLQLKRQASDDRQSTLTVEVTSHGARSIQIEKIAIEQNEGNIKAARYFENDELELNLQRLEPQDSSNLRSSFSKFTLPVPRRFDQSRKLIVKVVGIDDLGRRCVAWSECRSPSPQLVARRR